VTLLDVRAELPRTDWEIGRSGPKTSATIHWNGPRIPADVDPLDIILGDAHYHVSKDWSPEPGIQGADGIQYHELIAPDGTAYVTRDPDAALWHCGDPVGNETSYAIQVMVGGEDDGSGDPVTPAQYATLRARIHALGLTDVRPHRSWSQTTCPGNELATWVYAEGWQVEDDLDRTTFNAWFREQQVAEITPTLESMKKAYDPLVAQARANGLVDATQEQHLAELDARLAKLRTV
jgi:hypothetical protein